MRRVAVLGSGPVAKVLANGLKTHGYEVRIGNRSPEKIEAFGKETGIPTGTPAEAAAWADTVVLAVAGRAAEEALAGAGAANLRGKIVIDTTNPIAGEPPVDGVLRFFTGPNDSLMERCRPRSPTPVSSRRSSRRQRVHGRPLFRGGSPRCSTAGRHGGESAVARLIEQFGWEGATWARGRRARPRAALSALVHPRPPGEPLVTRLQAASGLARRKETLMAIYASPAPPETSGSPSPSLGCSRRATPFVS